MIHTIELYYVHLGNLYIALWFDQNLKAIIKNNANLWNNKLCFSVHQNPQNHTQQNCTLFSYLHCKYDQI